MGMGLVVALFTNVVHQNSDILHIGLTIFAVLIVGWLFATIFNVAIFAPAYWLFGKLGSKRKPRSISKSDSQLE